VESESKFSSLEGPERLIGSRVLEFELTQVLGAGGMSVVYRARHRITHQEVAIKILPPELATNDELKARFVEEARVLALLEHPSIVALNNFCEAGGRLCLIMQFVDGVTFEHKIVGAGKLPWPEVLRVGVEVLKALEYAHGRQVIHRDIKPSNVLVRSDGAVKVTDFGIAKMLGASRLTSTGQTMGTVRYMSPEQVRGKVVDARSDYYSLGVTLFEGLAGRTPFEGENQFEIMQQHLNRRPPSFKSLGVRAPEQVEKALLCAMEKDPKDRFQDATEFRRALEAVLVLANDPSALASARSTARTRTVALALGGVVALAGSAGGAFVLLRHRGEATPPSQTTQTIKTDVTTAQLPKPSLKVPQPVAPHVVPGLILKIDQAFDADGLRVQSAVACDVAHLHDRYRNVITTLRAFMRGEPELRAAADQPIAPITIVVVPGSVLDKPELWPGYPVSKDSTYSQRYVETRRTLFLADTPEFDARELPYGVALHALAPIRTISTDQLYSLAEKFQASYFSPASKKSPK
jgi:serine/threonine-protein kinase